MAPLSSVYTEAAKKETQQGWCTELSQIHITVSKQICPVKAHSLLELQLLSPCLFQAGHLDIITLHVLVLFGQDLQAILTEIKDLSDLQEER